MKNKSNEYGNIIIEVILAIIILGAIGGAIYSNHHKVPSTKAKTTTTVAVGKSGEIAQKSPGSVRPAQVSKHVWVIKELGIQMTLPDELRNLQYVAIYDYYGKASGYGVTSDELVKIDPNCTALESAIGNLVVDKSDRELAHGSTITKKDLGDGKALFFTQPNGSCFTARAIVDDQVTFEKNQKIEYDQTLLLRDAVQTAKYISN